MKRVCFVLLLCMFLLYPSARIAQAGPLPLAEMNSVSLVESCNTLLSLAKQDYRCTVPELNTGENGERMFCSYIGEANPAKPGYGVLIMNENNEGNVLNAAIAVDMKDQVMMEKSIFVITYVGMSCGLTAEEVNQLVSDENWKPGNHEGIEIQTSTIRSSAMNRLYTLIVSLDKPEENGGYITLLAHD